MRTVRSALARSYGGCSGFVRELLVDRYVQRTEVEREGRARMSHAGSATGGLRPSRCDRGEFAEADRKPSLAFVFSIDRDRHPLTADVRLHHVPKLPIGPDRLITKASDHIAAADSGPLRRRSLVN